MRPSADFCTGCSEDAPFATFLWLEVTAAVLALLAALALSFPTSRWASLGRLIAVGLAASALALLPGTLRQTSRHRYDALRWGYPIALTATLVALVATVVAALVAFRRLTEPNAAAPDPTA